MLVQLTEKYIEAFNSKNIKAVSLLLDEKFVLKDPVVKKIEGKEKSLGVIQEIFNSSPLLRFDAHNIFSEGNVTIIEFELQLDESVLEGVDILVWKDEKIVELRAYLDVPK